MSDRNVPDSNALGSSLCCISTISFCPAQNPTYCYSVARQDAEVGGAASKHAHERRLQHTNHQVVCRSGLWPTIRARDVPNVHATCRNDAVLQPAVVVSGQSTKPALGKYPSTTSVSSAACFAPTRLPLAQHLHNIIYSISTYAMYRLIRSQTFLFQTHKMHIPQIPRLNSEGTTTDLHAADRTEERARAAYLDSVRSMMGYCAM